jgi:MFS family permease
MPAPMPWKVTGNPMHSPRSFCLFEVQSPRSFRIPSRLMRSAPTDSLRSELRSLPRAYWVLVGGWFVNRFGTFVVPFLTLFLTSRGHPPTSVALVLSMNGLGQFSASLLGGYFSDRFGRRHTIVIGTFANAAAIFSLYFAHEIGAIAGFMFLAGFAGGFYMPASNALLADLVPEPLRLRAYSLQRVAINAGFACGSAAAGFLIGWSIFALFAGDAITTAAFGVIALTMLPHGLRVAKKEASWSQAWVVLRRDGAFWALCASTILTSFVFQQFGSTFSLEVKQRNLTLDLLGWHLGPEMVFGMILAWNGTLVATCELPLTRWTQRFESRNVITLGYLLLGGGFAINALHGGVGMFFGAMTVFTIGEMLSQPMRSAYVAALAPETMRGRYMGALAMAATSANIFGPHVSLPFHARSPAGLWLTCGALGVLAAVVLACFGRKARGDSR